MKLSMQIQKLAVSLDPKNAGRNDRNKRNRKKPRTNDRGEMVITPEQQLKHERTKAWKDRVLQPGGDKSPRGGIHRDQNRKKDNRRRRHQDNRDY